MYQKFFLCVTVFLVYTNLSNAHLVLSNGTLPKSDDTSVKRKLTFISNLVLSEFFHLQQAEYMDALLDILYPIPEAVTLKSHNDLPKFKQTRTTKSFINLIEGDLSNSYTLLI